MTDYQAVIGLELHVQLATKSKMFCSCANSYGQPPNSLTCPVCLGLPGALPVANQKALGMGIRFALAAGAKLASEIRFDRKNYFYPDLPKGYQITQYYQPLSTGGKIRIEAELGNKYISLIECHLEEDAGKSIHVDDATLIDLNRCGVPLLEIVTEPCIESPQEAYLFLKRLKAIVQYLGISHADMEKGELRCDANISVKKADKSDLGSKVELKNLNSFRFIRKALEYEYQRQVKLAKKGEKILRETRLYDENKNLTLTMRSKEESPDYRFFPEANLPPLKISDESKEDINQTIPELPDQKLDRYTQQFGLPDDSATILCNNIELAEFFDETVKLCDNPKMIANWILTELLGLMAERKESMKQIKVSPEGFTELINKIGGGVISGKIGRQVLELMTRTGDSAGEIIEREGLRLITDKKLLMDVIEEVICKNRENLKKYLDGRENLYVFFVGQVMAKTDGRADPAVVNKLLRETLDDKKT